MSRLVVVSLVSSIIGIFLLLMISFYIQPKEITSYSHLKENDYVKVHGKIISSRYFSESDFSILLLENNITIICDCKFPVNKTIIAEGKVEEYKNTLQINAEKIIVK